MVTIHGRLEELKQEQISQALEVIFTPWQVQILTKRAEDSTLTSAEKQELSRRIKPKILAMEALQDLKHLLPFYS